ncbi:MAG TPA: septation protein IspZ [Caulobacteraceae bacterium]|nr:septation protein IspZ [Caulobacteraceae bacterium]
MSVAAQERPAHWVRHLANAAPAVGFLATLLVTHDFRKATWALIALSVAALGLCLAVERRIAPIPAVSGVAALGFGGLSLALHRNDLLQMKMTIVDAIFGAALFGGLVLRRNPLKRLLGAALQLPDHAWRVLTIRYGLFFWASAIANEIVRRTQSAEVWATFRVAAIAAAVVFGAAQFPFLKRYWTEAETPDPPEPGF